MKRSGFTLIELLAVLAITIILASLVAPAIQKAREAARRAHCSNNLKQFVIAVSSYCELNGGYLPTASGPNPSGWVVAFMPFLEQTTANRLSFGRPWWPDHYEIGKNSANGFQLPLTS
jgi:prepilin-type N-terminal cleavage/methylation domain-containing protein